MQKFVHKFVRNTEDYGLGVALRKALSYAVSPVYESRSYRIYRMTLDGSSHAGRGEDKGIHIQHLQPEDHAWIREIEEHAEWLRGALRNRLEQGAVCLVAFKDSELAGFNLVSFGSVRIPLIHQTRKLRPHEAWSSQITVFKPFRRQGLASRLRYDMFDELRSRKIRKLYGGTLCSNLPAMKLAKRVGFDALVDVHYSRMLWQRRWRYHRVRGSS